jgi:hypothetical protein
VGDFTIPLQQAYHFRVIYKYSDRNPDLTEIHVL